MTEMIHDMLTLMALPSQRVLLWATTKNHRCAGQRYHAQCVVDLCSKASPSNVEFTFEHGFLDSGKEDYKPCQYRNCFAHEAARHG